MKKFVGYLWACVVLGWGAIAVGGSVPQAVGTITPLCEYDENGDPILDRTYTGVPSTVILSPITLFGKNASIGDYIAFYVGDKTVPYTLFEIEADYIEGFPIPLNAAQGSIIRMKFWNHHSGLEAPEIFVPERTITAPDPNVFSDPEIIPFEVTGSAPTYTVTFDLGGKATRTGGGALSQTIAYGENALMPEILANSGYAFVAWDETPVDVRKPMTITAIFEETSEPEPTYPDLVVNALSTKKGTTATTSFLTTEAIAVTFNVVNQGTAEAPASTAYIYDGTTKLGEVAIAALAVSGATPGTYTIPAGALSAGNHTIKVVADGANAITEADDDNNASTTSITISAPIYPDLVVNALSTKKGTTATTSFLTTEAIAVTFNVVNQGAAEAPASTAYIYDGTTKLGEVAIAALAVSGATPGTYTIPAGALSAGNHTIKVVADGANAITESDDNNNASTTTISISTPTPTPDPDPDPGADAFEYTIENGEVTITLLKDKELSTVTIPTTIQGLPVTAIGPSAFKNSKIRTLTIPESVTTIGREAFRGCTKLSSLVIHDNVTSIGEYAFSVCTSLPKYDGVRYESSAKKLLIDVDDERIKTFVVPSSVKYIGPNAFVFAPLSSITFPEGLKVIGDGAFMFCDKLSSIALPNSLVAIGNEAFFSCDILKVVEIPENVTAIGEEAFWYCTSLGMVTLSDGVAVIGDSAFDACNSLESMLFRARPPAASDFRLPSGVTGYYYASHAAAWEQVLVNGKWNGRPMVEVPDGEGVRLPTSSPAVFLRVIGEGGATGTLAGAKTYRVKQKATVRATAAKGSAFAGWYLDAACAQPYVNGADWRNPSLSITMDAVKLLLYAKFVPATADTIIAIDATLPVVDVGESFTVPLEVISASLPKLTIKGLPKGLKYDAKTLAIAGAVATPGYYTFTVAGTNASVKKATEATTATFTLQVRNRNELITDAGYDKDMLWTEVKSGEATMFLRLNDGLIGASVKGLPKGLKWDAKTGTLSGTTWAYGKVTLTFTNKQKEVTDITLDIAPPPPPIFSELSCKCLGRDYNVPDVGISMFETSLDNLAEELKTELALTVTAGSGDKAPTIKIAGIPTGLRATQKKVGTKVYITISGTPTKAGVYDLTIAATDQAKIVTTKVYTLTIAPTYAVGTYCAILEDVLGYGTPVYLEAARKFGNKSMTFRILYMGKQYKPRSSYLDILVDEYVTGAYYEARDVAIDACLSITPDGAATMFFTDYYLASYGIYQAPPSQKADAAFVASEGLVKSYTLNLRTAEGEVWRGLIEVKKDASAVVTLASTYGTTASFKGFVTTDGCVYAATTLSAKSPVKQLLLKANLYEETSTLWVDDERVE